MANELEQALGSLIIRSKKTTTRQMQANTQRRNLVMDDFDKEYVGTSNGGTCQIWLSISPDMMYIERWEFKLIVESGNFSDLRMKMDGRDFTAELKAQFPTPVTKPGIYPDSSVNNRYDLLEAFSVLSNEEREPFLKQGYHNLEFVATSDFTIKIREFKKYSFINRHGGTESTL